MQDDWLDLIKISVVILLIAVLGITSYSVYGAVKNQFEQSIDTVLTENITVNKDDTASKKAEVIIEKVETDTLLNTDNYIDNTQNIVNEAPAVSYVTPITIAIIAIFMMFMLDRYIKYKREKATHTEKILNIPLQTFEQTETDALKKKYSELE